MAGSLDWVTRKALGEAANHLNPEKRCDVKDHSRSLVKTDGKSKREWHRLRADKAKLSGYWKKYVYLRVGVCHLGWIVEDFLPCSVAGDTRPRSMLSGVRRFRDLVRY